MSLQIIQLGTYNKVLNLECWVIYAYSPTIEYVFVLEICFFKTLFESSYFKGVNYMPLKCTFIVNIKSCVTQAMS